MTMRCSHPSFLRKQESRPPAPAARWMPDHVRHDGSPPARRELSVKRASMADDERSERKIPSLDV